MFDSLIIGIVQGLSEFLPISSSGHVVFFETLLQFNEGKGFAAAIHLGTCIAAIIYFRKEVVDILKSFINFKDQDEMTRKNRELGIRIIIATIPAVILGLIVSKLGLEDLYKDLFSVGVASIFFAILLFIADKYERKENTSISSLNAFVIGSAQIIAAIFAGASRSGVTLTTSFFLNIDKEVATKFVFLISIPITGLAAINEIFLKKSVEMNTDLFVAFIAALISGLFAIKFLLYFVRNSKLEWLILYRILFGVAAMAYSMKK